jgi:endonuclease YncB( thermonuclease family)
MDKSSFVDMTTPDMEIMNSHKKTKKFTLDGLVTPAKCVKVYDGDTAQFCFSICTDRPVTRFACRILRYNTAEMKGKGVTEEEKFRGRECRDALAELILDKIVTLYVKKFDKYGRPLIECTIEHDGAVVNISDWMIEKGYGFSYNGAGEKRWK